MNFKKVVFRVGVVFFLIFNLWGGFCDFGNQIYNCIRRVSIPDVNALFSSFVEKEFSSQIRSQISQFPNTIKLWGGHLDHTRNLMRKAAQIALSEKKNIFPSRALIVGAGNCFDIPLKELTEMFDEIYLLDLARETIIEIIETGRYYQLREADDGWYLQEDYLSKNDLAKLEFIYSDASGGAAFKMAERVDDLVEKSNSGQTVTREDIINILDNIELKQVPFDDGYFDFVSSATVLSDLLVLPGIYIASRLFEIDMAAHANELEWGKKLFALNERVSEFHVRELERLLSPNGRVFVSAIEYTVELFQPGDEGSGGDFLKTGNFIGHSTREITMSKDLSKLVQPYFQQINREQDSKNEWLWQNGENNAVAITALVLAKKDEFLEGTDKMSIDAIRSLSETMENIHMYPHPFIDTLSHLAEKLAPLQWWEYLVSFLVKNRRLYYMMHSEFEEEDVVFEENFTPYLYRTTPGFLTINNLRQIFFGDGQDHIKGITLGGDVVLTSIMRIANNVDLRDTHFYAANYVGEGWQLSNVKMGRSVLSDGITNGGGVVTSRLSNITVIHSYVGAGADIRASLLKNTVIPEGRVFRKATKVEGMMSEDITLADYLEDYVDDIELNVLLSGENRIPGSDIDFLPYAGRLTSIATALCILYQRNEQSIVEQLLYTLPADIADSIREKMSVISLFVSHDLYNRLN
ncbi:MAG: hypothetical protein P9M06_05005 [Candidatus Saelkia tenebricola]|nr:hypothetical protein [Candidatus Saelkia tenebricola]